MMPTYPAHLSPIDRCAGLFLQLDQIYFICDNALNSFHFKSNWRMS